jgi:leucyl-tRNA synthetase
MLELNTINLGVQVNGKIRSQIKVSSDSSDEDIISTALEQPKIQSYTEGKNIVKSMVIPKKLVVLVVK